MNAHKHHPDILQRLRRAKGHLSKVIDMIDEERACLDVAQQLQAVEHALTNAKKTFIHNHLDECVSSDRLKQPETHAECLAEIKEITKYL